MVFNLVATVTDNLVTIATCVSWEQSNTHIRIIGIWYIAMH